MLFQLHALRIRSALRFPNLSVPHEVSCQTFPERYRWRPHGTVDIREHDHVRVPQCEDRGVRCAHNVSIALLPLCHLWPRPKRLLHAVLRHVGFRGVLDPKKSFEPEFAHQLDHAKIAIQHNRFIP